MKATTLVSISLPLSFLISGALFAEPTRSVFLNGIDISSTKNQSMQHVNVSIDSQGNIYIEAPQYEAQQETTFVPLGRQNLSSGRTPQHKAPGPLPTTASPSPSTGPQPGLAPTGDSRDTLGGTDELKPKEGARIPNDPRVDAGAEAQSDTPKNSGVR